MAPSHAHGSCKALTSGRNARHERPSGTLLKLVFDLPSTHTIICGDPEQMLYDFEQDDPARLDYLKRPADFFGSQDNWTFERLSVSFRLTPPVAHHSSTQ